MIEVHEQYVLPVADIDPDRFAEVRDELAYGTLRLHDGPTDRLIQSLRDALPRYAVVTAERWAEVGSQFAEQYAILRDGSRSEPERNTARAVLRATDETDEEEQEEARDAHEAGDDEEHD